MTIKQQYGFYDYLSAEFPSQIMFDVTEVCNYKCTYCPHSEFVNSSVYAGRHLDINIHNKIIDEIVKDGLSYCRYLRYTANGEPFVHPKFMNMLEYAKKHLSIPINITTNGSMLNSKRADKILEIGIDVIDISICAYKDSTYKTLTITGDLERVHKSVLELLDKIRKGVFSTRVLVSLVEQPANADEVNDFKEYWTSQGVNKVLIRPLHSAGASKDEIAAKLKEAAVHQTRKPCLYPWERLVVNPLGKASFCPADWEYSFNVGDLETQTIKEIWQSDIMNDVRNAHLNNDFSQYIHCGKCPDWMLIKWPHEGKSYAELMKTITEEKKNG